METHDERYQMGDRDLEKKEIDAFIRWRVENETGQNFPKKLLKVKNNFEEKLLDYVKPNKKYKMTPLGAVKNIFLLIFNNIKDPTADKLEFILFNFANSTLLFEYIYTAQTDAAENVMKPIFELGGIDAILPQKTPQVKTEKYRRISVPSEGSLARRLKETLSKAKGEEFIKSKDPIIKKVAKSLYNYLALQYNSYYTKSKMFSVDQVFNEVLLPIFQSISDVELERLLDYCGGNDMVFDKAFFVKDREGGLSAKVFVYDIICQRQQVLPEKSSQVTPFSIEEDAEAQAISYNEPESEKKSSPAHLEETPENKLSQEFKDKLQSSGAMDSLSEISTLKQLLLSGTGKPNFFQHELPAHFKQVDEYIKEINDAGSVDEMMNTIEMAVEVINGAKIISEGKGNIKDIDVLDKLLKLLNDLEDQAKSSTKLEKGS